MICTWSYIYWMIFSEEKLVEKILLTVIMTNAFFVTSFFFNFVHTKWVISSEKLRARFPCSSLTLFLCPGFEASMHTLLSWKVPPSLFYIIQVKVSRNGSRWGGPCNSHTKPSQGILQTDLFLVYLFSPWEEFSGVACSYSSAPGRNHFYDLLCNNSRLEGVKVLKPRNEFQAQNVVLLSSQTGLSSNKNPESRKLKRKENDRWRKSLAFDFLPWNTSGSWV